MWEGLLAAGVFAADQYGKYKVERNAEFRDKKILKGQVTLTRYHNTGVFLNALSKKKTLVRLLTTGLLGLLLLLFGLALSGKEGRLSKVGLSLLVGGAASNVWDRWRRGYVVDYFTFKKIPRIVFNLGDLAIFLGALLCLVLLPHSGEEA